MKARPLAACAVLTALLGAGCATVSDSGDAASREPVRYDYIYETGSLLPKKVRRDKAADRAQNLQVVEASRLEQMQRDQMIRNMPRVQPGG